MSDCVPGQWISEHHAYECTTHPGRWCADSQASSPDGWSCSTLSELHGDPADFRRRGAAMARYAESLAGIPFEHQGRLVTEHGGLDCLGVVTAVATEFGISHEDFVEYDHDVDGARIVHELSRWADQVDPEDMRDGDVLLLWTKDHSESPQHFGVVARDPHSRAAGRGFVHALERNTPRESVVTHQTLTAYWRANVHSVWRYRWLDSSHKPR